MRTFICVYIYSVGRKSHTINKYYYIPLSLLLLLLQIGFKFRQYDNVKGVFLHGIKEISECSLW